MDSPQGLEETSDLAIVNCGTGRHLKVVNGSLATVPNTSDDDSYRVVGAGEADQTLQAIINHPSVEATTNSIPQQTITPKEENSETFYITDPQSGTCLRDAGSGSEIDPISTETFSIGPEHDDTRLWRVLAPAADNLTPIDNTIKYARPAMELLLSQWVDATIGYTPEHPVSTVASIDKNDIKTLKKEYPGMKKKEEEALLNGGVRIDRQGYIDEKKVHFANMQGQVKNKSVWQVNVQTGHKFGVAVIRDNMTESMNSKPPKEIWLRV